MKVKTKAEKRSINTVGGFRIDKTDKASTAIIFSLLILFFRERCNIS